MAWFNLGWLQVVWFVVVVYAVTAAVVHLLLRRLIRRRAAADAEARGVHQSPPPQRGAARSLGSRLAAVGSAAARLRRSMSVGGATMVVLPRPNVQVPQIAARPTRPTPRGGLSEGTPTMAITLLPRQRVIDLARVERSGADRESPVSDGPVHWWNATRR